MRIIKMIIPLVALMIVNFHCVMPKEIVGDINVKQIEQDEGLYDSDPMEQLKSLQETMLKLQSMQEMVSAQVSLIQREDSQQKIEMQRIQRDSEQKERQMRNQLNDLADENQNLRQLLVKIMTAKNQSESESNILAKDSPTPGYRREFNQYMEETGGVTYIRWGRTTCEDPAYPLYTGYAVSGASNSGSSNPGGSIDIACLHSQPQYVDMFTGTFSKLYGLEYDFVSLPFSTVNNGGASLQYNDMPCTLCHVSSRSHQFMLPGRNTCPSGWVREYWGYLVSSNSNYSPKNSLVCLDEAPEAVPGGAVLAHGGNIYPVEATCTAIYCPPYRADYELPCAVC